MIIKSIIIAVLALAAYHQYKLILRSDTYVQHHAHKPPSCKYVPGIRHGSEDFDLLSDGTVFVTSGLRSKALPPAVIKYMEKHNNRGGIFKVDLNQNYSQIEAKPVKIEPSSGFDSGNFWPHGLSVLEHPQGRHAIFVVAHFPKGADKIIKFRYNPQTNSLAHEKTYFEENVYGSLNDVAAVGEDHFYTTSIFYSTQNNLKDWELYFLLPWGSVYYYNGEHFHQVVANLNIPNGITASRRTAFTTPSTTTTTNSNSKPEDDNSNSNDNQRDLIYVSVLKDLHVYERFASDGCLNLIQQVELHSVLDNSVFSLSGDTLYIGSHPMLYKLAEHLLDPEMNAPSHVLELPLSQGMVKVDEVRELMYDHGDFISGSSAAVMHNDLLLIGTVFRDMAVCKKPV